MSGRVTCDEDDEDEVHGHVEHQRAFLPILPSPIATRNIPQNRHQAVHQHRQHVHEAGVMQLRSD